MALLHGKAGKVVWNAEDGASDIDISNVTSWNLDAAADVAEITNMASVGDWKEYLASFKSGTVTVECNADDGGPEVLYATVGANDGLGEAYEADGIQKVFLELWFTQLAAGGLIYCPAIATGINHSIDANDAGKVSYTFQINGEIMYKAVEPVDFSEPLS